MSARARRDWAVLGAAVLATFIFIFDMIAPQGGAEWVLYLLPLWILVPRIHYVRWFVAPLGFTVILMLDAVEPLHPDAWSWAQIGGRVIGIVMIWIGSLLIARRKHAERRTEALLALTQSITGTLDKDELLQRAQSAAADALNADAVAILYPDRDGGTRLVSSIDLPAEIHEQVRDFRFQEPTPWARRLVGSLPIVINQPAGAEEQRWSERLGLGALISVPLLIQERFYGVLFAGRRRDPFIAEDIELAAAAARQIGVSLAAAQMYRKQKEEAQVSATFAQATSELIASVGSHSILETLCKVAKRAIDCDASALLLWDPDEQVYSMRATNGLSAESIELLRLLRVPADELRRFAGQLDEHGLPVDTTGAVSTRWRVIPTKVGMTLTTFAALARGTEIIGLLILGFRDRHLPCSKVQLRVLRAIAHVAPLVIENGRLFANLERADRLKSDFLATISHELRTPMNIILGYNELLRAQTFGSLTDDQEQTLAAMDKSGRQLLELINATLDISRLEEGRMPVDVIEVQIAELLQEVRDESSHFLDKPDVQCVWETIGEVPPLATDPMKLKIVLKNLLHNAAKFTRQGEIRVGVEARDQGVELRVRDTGIGIARDKWLAVFEPFHQLNSSDSPSAEGVGLGLYLVQRLLELLGGSIQLESEVGKGTEFRIWIPQSAHVARPRP